MQKRFDGMPVTEANPADVVMTPRHIAEAIVRHFEPSGAMLDPCRGDGAFFDLMPGAAWCEVREGRDFFDCGLRVDWIVSNPPFSIFYEWMRHSMTIANDIVYLVPIGKVWNSAGFLDSLTQWGGVREILVIGTGRSIGFPLGFAVGAVHFQRGYKGAMTYGFMTPNV